MRLNSQIGKSFFEILAVFLVVSVAFGIGFSKYTQDKHHENMLKITETMHVFFDKYQKQAPEIFKQASVPNGSVLIKSYALLDECKEKPSFFNKYKQVCVFGLGEIDVKVDVGLDQSVRTDVYVHFFDMYKKHSCRQFLSVGWEKVLPKNWWSSGGYIGVISENTNGKMYFSRNPEYIRNDGAQENPTRQHMKNVCDTCKGSRYCTIMFSFKFDENSLKNVTFPAEFVKDADKKDGKDDKDGKDKKEKEEISKKGKTYTKTSGNSKEVVTFGKNTFKGATYSGGALTSVYQGTYSSRGITSYKSYDPSRGSLKKQVKNISYDKSGKVQSYETASKKILLTGNANDCLILDEENKTKKFARCADLFKEEKSSLLLQYDNKGLLREVVVEGDEKKAYTFSYDEDTGELINYCEENSKKCHKVIKGKTVKDILKRDVPTTSGKFDSLYRAHDETNTRKERPKQRIMTREEALKRVKDGGNQIKIIMK